MTYTRHGHHIKGTVLEDRPIGLLTARCGGPGVCKDCSIDTTAALMKDVQEIVEKANETVEEENAPKKVYYTKETVEKLYKILNKSEILDLDQTYRVIDAMQEAGIYVQLTKEG